LGIYSEYLDRRMDINEIHRERKRQLQRISELRGRDIIVFAADLNKGGKAPISIGYDDLLPFSDQLSNLSGEKLDIILETPGGVAEVAEDIVKMIRQKYDDVAFIIPGTAKSSGTIMAMSGDDILMEPMSSLGPIDAQIVTPQGKRYSAEALIKGIEKIKEEADRTQILSKAYIPILQGISPGEIEEAQNALDFAKVLVSEWLVKYKFKKWTHHSSSGEPVTEEEKRLRANEIASLLCKHEHWLSHGRSIKIEDLRKMKLIINDYSQNPELADAIRRYHVLMQMTFQSNIYKIFETVNSQIYRLIGNPQQQQFQQNIESADIKIECPQCKNVFQIQANFEPDVPLKQGRIPFPGNNQFECPKCHFIIDVSRIRNDVELKAGKKLITGRGLAR